MPSFYSSKPCISSIFAEKAKFSQVSAFSGILPIFRHFWQFRPPPILAHFKKQGPHAPARGPPRSLKFGMMSMPETANASPFN